MEWLKNFLDINSNEDAPFIIKKSTGEKDWLSNKTIIT